MYASERVESGTVEQIIRDAGWTCNELYNPYEYIRSLRSGISSSRLKGLLSAVGVARQVIAINAMTDESNLARFFRRDSLPEQQSEALLDTAKVYLKAIAVFEDKAIALEWMDSEVPALSGQRPVDLMDSFEGRKWVVRVLGHIEHGDFS